MRIAILSRNKSLYSTRRLVEAALQRGHDVRVIDHVRCFMDITSEKPSVHYREEEFETGHFDAVIPRIGASVSFYGCAVVRQFEMMGSYCVNESVAITRARDKLRSLQLLSRKGIGIPATSFANSPDDVEGLIREVGGAPLVISNAAMPSALVWVTGSWLWVTRLAKASLSLRGSCLHVTVRSRAPTMIISKQMLRLTEGTLAGRSLT